MPPKRINLFKDRYWFLSNFYPCDIRYEGITYPSIEHAFQAAKTISKSMKVKISHLARASLAKRAGRKLPLRKDWEKVKQTTMYNLLKIKFRDPTLAEKLLRTGSAELIEGNWWGDTYWGICEGKGQNYLGRLLMKVRKEMKL